MRDGGRWVRGLSRAVAVSWLLVGGSHPVAAAEGAELAVSAGAYDLSQSTASEAGLEYRLRSRAWELVPVIGLAATDDEAYWAYAGLRRPFRVGRGWRLTPGFAVALYEEGAGTDLGGALEFRSSLELSRRFAGGQSLGLAVYHLSNAGIYRDNPGSNSLILTWALPVSGP